MTWAGFLALPRKVAPSAEELRSQEACESENLSGDSHLPVLGGTLAQTWEVFSTRNEENQGFLGWRGTVCTYMIHKANAVQGR